MAPRFNIWVTGCALLALALLCPVHTFERLPVDQTEEDLTFDDEDTFLLRIKRDADTDGVSSGVSKRQLFPNSLSATMDDETIGVEDYSGDGEHTVGSAFKTYRIKFVRNVFYNSKLSDTESSEFKKLKTTLERKLKDSLSKVDGAIDVHVVKIGTGNSGKQQEVMMDITHEGIPNQNDGHKIQSVMEEILASRFMETVPGSLSFTDIRDRSGARCKPNEELCPEGICVPRCDGVRDCESGADEDERNCQGFLTPSPIEVELSNATFTEVKTNDENCSFDEIVCDYNRCISSNKYCDGVPDCRDGTDEADCPGFRTTPAFPPTTKSPPVPLITTPVRPNCSEQELECDNKCISLEQLCDGVRDCSDSRDEVLSWCPPVSKPPECQADEFQCNDSTCIKDFRRCDLIQDCPSNEDEENCLCNPPNYQCNSGQCIEGSKHCDGIEDCNDGTDESVGCWDRICNPWEHKCDDGVCIHIDLKCDGKVDCRDGSDEYDCTATCRIDQFTCDNGKCLNLDLRCNRYPDCPNGEDEKSCSCDPDQFRCANGLCISASKRCDGIPDCPQDGSDERDCPRPCTADEFTCGDGSCIEKSWRCDLSFDCLDRSDEENCGVRCDVNEFDCGNSCIHESLRCDGTYDCPDRRDEQNCPCPPFKFNCKNGECIDRSAVCDQKYDCLDRSDEENCATFTPPRHGTEVPETYLCGPEQFQCDNNHCIELTKYCDAFFDCPDLSDEVDCPRPECELGQFRCDSGQCIDYAMRCNQAYDCPDASDELDCEAACGSFEFECRSGECVSRTVVCDGRIDCLDRSDEDNCIDNSTWVCDRRRDFICNDGLCVSLYAQCDGRFDCQDRSDETNCPLGINCDPASEFQCYSGECVPISVQCDGHFDCLDNSDEKLCPSPQPQPITTTPPPRPLPRPCAPYQFRCLSGDCVDASHRCDGNYDCRDSSDEFGCPPPTRPPTPPPRPTCGPNEFACRNGQCIIAGRQCDGNFDCFDRSDEENCPDPFICYNGQRIPERLRCDGKRDCFDGSDEEGCPGSCSAGEFQCLSGGECINEALKCDGSFDCLDRSDEARCDGQPEPFPPSPTDSLDLRTYPDDQNIKQSREVVFQCRDEGPLRKPVRWVRAGGQRLPPGTTDVRGRLTMPNVQLEHSGSYYCEAQEVPPNMPGYRKAVTLRVIPFEMPTVPPFTPACSKNESTCRTGECIPRDAVCDGDNDCLDGSDEVRCDPLGCEPNEFQCDNKQCIGKAWICDADNDCGDESDERNCDGPKPPGSTCNNYEFTCQKVNQCVPKSFHCDNEIDCQDGSDEFGCSKPTVIEPPKRHLSVDISQTFTITCKAVGVPIPIIVWRLNWGHVPPSCTMTSEEGYGVLTCVNAQPYHQGAYSCEAINALGSVFAEPDAIVHVKTSESVCSPPAFNAAATKPGDCLDCFCFGNTDQCYSTERYVSQLPPPTTSPFEIVGVNQDQFQGNYVIRNREYPLSSRYLRPYSNLAAVTVKVPDRNRLGGPSDLLIYFSLPDTHKGSQLTAYGGYLRYIIQFENVGIGRTVSGPDVILKGNNITIMHVHDYMFEVGRRNQIDVRFWPGNWYKKIFNIGRIQSHEPANRREIITVLENIELFLIRASYTDGNDIDTTLSSVQLDTVVFQATNQGRAVYVEECRCPPGYTGMSCEECAPNYRRTLDGPYLGRCVLDVSCGPNEYGDPANDIPCLACPCPLTNPANQFSQSCYLDSDGQVTCNCQRGYKGRRCESCADGYEGNPTVPGKSCQPAGECDASGSLSLQPDPSSGLCQCKDYVGGSKCSECQPGSFYLNENNQYGCIKCFCMGITDRCSSSNLYRTEEVINFSSDTRMHGVQLVDQYQRSVINNNLFTDVGRQELLFRTFKDLPLETYYWKLPQRFLGDKVTAYGANLTFTLQYSPAPAGQSSKNNAYDVEIYGNDVTLRYYSRQELSPGSLGTVSVPFYEQFWQRQDGQTANREHFLMALADLEYILIKATYTTNTQEVGLKEVRMGIAAPRNTGQERAYAVEQCACPTGYRGLSCEDCDVGFTRGLSGLYLGTCEPCDCNGYSYNCDPETGDCINCNENRAGDRCQECAEGYYEDYGERCERIQPCSCDPRGSLSAQCERDQCQCKPNVQGDECKTCREGHFFLSEKNPDGCLKCWCRGVTNRCSSSQYYREQIPMNLFDGHGFTLADRLRTNIVSEDLDVSVPDNKISYNRFDLLSPHTTYYWSLPQIFTGNRLTSYGGQLSVTQSFDSRSISDIYSDADIIITSADKREFIWMNPDMLKPRRQQNYTVTLVESQFTVDQRPATREEFLASLANVEAILIRAQFSSSMDSTSLQYVTLDTAVDYQTGQPRAFEVEHCSCPSEYIGFSCEECAQGYYRDFTSNTCLRCPCNGKEESCVGERDGSVRCNCLHGFTGPNCGSSEGPETPTGTIEVTISQPYYDAEVGATIELVCSAAPGPRVSIQWDREGRPLPYGRSSDNYQGTLVITQVRPEDAGIYICRATTGVYVGEERTELIVRGGPPPSKPVVIIEERTEEVEVSIGQYFEVRCRASGSPQPFVQWLRADGRPLPSTVIQQNGILTFHNPQYTDSGEYICRGSNTQGMASARISIYVGEPRTPVEEPEDLIIVQVFPGEVEARPGEVVRIVCSVTNNIIRATFSWTREQGELPEQSSQREGELIIPGALPADSGLYTCRVTDIQGRTGEATTRVNIVYYGNTPDARIEPNNQKVYQGTSVQMRCIATGDPQPVISWSKANEVLGPHVIIEGGLLRIESTVVNDRGLYICEAKNNVGKTRTSAILEVERREPPVIEIYPESRQIIERGSSAMLQCHLTGGIPSPTVSWARADGRPLTPNTVTLNGGVLRFNEVTGEEEGSYICTAVNDAGRMTATATLEIQSIPIIILRPSTSLSVEKGDAIHLECIAHGDPMPEVMWQKLEHDRRVDQDAQRFPERATLDIIRASLSDEGIYQCTATNAAGSSAERIQVRVRDSLPGYPPIPLPGPRPRPHPRPPQPPTPTEPETEVYQVPLGTDFTFKCFAEELEEGRDENIIYTFERTDGRPLPRGHTEVNGVLTVSNVGKDAEGEYACVIRERITSRIILTVYATVQVLEQPHVRLEPARQVVRPGDTVSLRCIVTGAQPITIRWSKETGSMPPSVTINGGELLFRGIATTDTGRYICEAINNVGRATSIAEVIVNERPLLTALQEYMTVSQGQTVDLRCETSGVNPASVRWSLERSRDLPRNAYALSSEAVLRITNAKPENQGRYKCEARVNGGAYTYDFINLTVRSSKVVNIHIRASSADVHVGDPVELYCDVTGEQGAIISWSRDGAPLPYNARAEGRSLRIANVQPNNGGVYICTVRTSSGVFEETYPLTIKSIGPTYNLGSRSVETRSTQFGSTVVIKCGVELTLPVSYTWSKQNEKLPTRAIISNDAIEIPEVQAQDAGTYICTARNDDKSVDVQTLLIVTGVVPKFSGNSYIALPTLPYAYLMFDLEISFKPNFDSGLILYNSQRDGPGDFVAFGLNDGYADFRFDIGSGPAILRSHERLTLGEWHTVKLSRNRKEGTMIVDGGVPVTGVSEGRPIGLDLIHPLYIGGVPNISQIIDQAGFSSGFEGCISRLVIGFVISELMRDARSQRGLQPCDTCSNNPCQNGGVCQEAYSTKGHKCICPAGFSGESCESTGESCYTGVCGTGRCVNIPGGLECFCPFGKTGPRCGKSILIYEPAFSRGAYMAYPTPRALKRFSVGMKVKPETLEDGLIMYCGQQERGEGDFTSLALRDRRLEFKFNTGTGTATLMSDTVQSGEWIKVHANRTDKVGSLRINDGPLQNAQSPGTSSSLNLRTPLFIGGVDRSKIEVAPDVKVSEGFTGCISEIELMELPVNIADSLIDSSNVDQCGVSLCSREPCLNGGVCTDDPTTSKGFVCTCPSGFFGPRCGSQKEGICARSKPCLNGGVCQEISNNENQCLCPLGYSGPNCEYESLPKESASFEKNSWIEIDRYRLPQDGISDQEVTIEFSTVHPDGLLFWLGQDPSVSGSDKDYLSLGTTNGFLEFSFHMDHELVTAMSDRLVNDGERHIVVFKRSKNKGTLQLDGLPPVFAEGSGTLFSFNTYGNIYIGGSPDLHKMTGSKYGVGFTGCIHRLKIGSNEIENFMDYALQGVNVSPCSSGIRR